MAHAKCDMWQSRFDGFFGANRKPARTARFLKTDKEVVIHDNSRDGRELPRDAS